MHVQQQPTQNKVVQQPLKLSEALSPKTSKKKKSAIDDNPVDTLLGSAILGSAQSTAANGNAAPAAAQVQVQAPSISIPEPVTD